MTRVKVCTVCRKTIPATIEHFHSKRYGRGDGLAARCKICACAAERERRRANPDRAKEAQDRWYEKHGAANASTRRSMNPDKIRAQRREYWQANADKMRADQNARRAQDPERFNARNRQWRAANLEHFRRRYRSDPAYRLNFILGTTIRKALQAATVRKCRRSWTEMVGYSADQLRLHLERQFLRGMSWENYGAAWHIDHILPLSSFVIDGPDSAELKAAWALTNLRPLWSPDNRAKGARRTLLL